MRKSQLIGALKKLIEKPFTIQAVPLEQTTIKRSLEILQKDNSFRKLKKEFTDLRSDFAKKANVSEEQASSLINYALHI